MSEHRHHIRVDCTEKCELYLKGWYYPAKVKNISFGGVFVSFYDKPPDLRLHVGDHCEVSLNGEDLRTYFGEVVRVEPSNIAIKFFDVRRIKAVH